MIVITTPTGQIAGDVLRIVSDAEEPVRVIVRDPARLPTGVAETVEVITGSHGDPAVIDAALVGADALLWVVPSDFQAASVLENYVDFSRPAAEAIRRRGVARVVSVSALGRNWNGPAGLVTDSIAMTGLMESTGASTRALAAAGFMDNMLRSVDSIREQGVFFGTIAPERKLPHVATTDIAAAAARLLLDPSWSGHGDIPLIGPEDLSFDEIAALTADVLGREVLYQQVSLEDLSAQMQGRGASPAFTRGMVEMMAAKDAGMDNLVQRTPENSSPTSYRAWAERVLKPAVEGTA